MIPPRSTALALAARALPRLLYLQCLVNAAQAASKLAVVRPLAGMVEISEMSKSFDIWNDKYPCGLSASDGPIANATVDLFLVYSRKLSESKHAEAAVNSVKDRFNRDSWSKCFHQIRVLDANLTPAQDIYDPRGQASNPNWVSGPNAVFRFIMNYFLTSDYDSFFLMEIDTAPQKPAWLNQFVLEATEENAPAISGSRYRGDNWDQFLSEMPDALLMHVNGNAIYNLKHSFLADLNQHIQEEAGTVHDRVAFDVRLAELALAVVSDTGNEVPYAAKSKLIGNYANTQLNNSFESDEFVKHGHLSNVFDSLDSQRVTLAVAHWSGADKYNNFMKHIGTYHPFDNVKVLSSDPDIGASSFSESTMTGMANISIIRAEKPNYMALCELAEHVQTEFFVFTDTLHVLASPVSVLMNGDKPVLPTLRASSKYCEASKACIESLANAKSRYGVDLAHHYDIYDTLFMTNFTKNVFCPHWSAGLGNKSFDTCEVKSGPTADDYMAALIKSNGRDASLDYTMRSREIQGWRSWTLLQYAHPVDPRTCSVYTQKEYEFAEGNISTCSQYVDQPDACNSNNKCFWKPMFQSGTCIPYHWSLDQGVGLLRGPAPKQVEVTAVKIEPKYVRKDNVKETIQKLKKLQAEEISKAQQERGDEQTEVPPPVEVAVVVTENSTIMLRSEPTDEQEQAILKAIADTRCGQIPRDECYALRRYTTTATTNNSADARRLQSEYGRNVNFDFSIIIRIEEDTNLSATIELHDEEFVHTFVAKVAKVQQDAIQASNSTGVSDDAAKLSESMDLLFPTPTFEAPTTEAVTIIAISQIELVDDVIAPTTGQTTQTTTEHTTTEQTTTEQTTTEQTTTEQITTEQTTALVVVAIPQDQKPPSLGVGADGSQAASAGILIIATLCAMIVICGLSLGGAWYMKLGCKRASGEEDAVFDDPLPVEQNAAVADSHQGMELALGMMNSRALDLPELGINISEDHDEEAADASGSHLRSGGAIMAAATGLELALGDSIDMAELGIIISEDESELAELGIRVSEEFASSEGGEANEVGETGGGELAERPAGAGVGALGDDTQAGEFMELGVAFATEESGDEDEEAGEFMELGVAFATEESGDEDEEFHV